MEKNYDFSKAERGKFFSKDAHHHMPIYLSEENLKFVEAIAARKNTDVNEVVNNLLKHDKEIAEVIS